VSCHGSAASLVSAAPADGYAVNVLDSGPEEVDVHFASSAHEYQVVARCSDGQPIEGEADDSSIAPSPSPSGGTPTNAADS